MILIGLPTCSVATRCQLANVISLWYIYQLFTYSILSIVVARLHEMYPRQARRIRLWQSISLCNNILLNYLPIQKLHIASHRISSCHAAKVYYLNIHSLNPTDTCSIPPRNALWTSTIWITTQIDADTHTCFAFLSWKCPEVPEDIVQWATLGSLLWCQHSALTLASFRPLTSYHPKCVVVVNMADSLPLPLSYSIHIQRLTDTVIDRDSRVCCALPTDAVAVEVEDVGSGA